MSSSPILDAILNPGGLSVKFQPILEVRGDGRRLHGVEALVRGPRGTNVEDAGVLFEYVRRKRQEAVVDRACVRVALEAASRLPVELTVAINVHASTLGQDHEFVSYLAEEADARHIALSRLTVEMVEHAPLWDGTSCLLDALDTLRHIGVRIALDDVGLGYSNYRMVIECRPDYFKVDRYLVKGARTDFYRQAVLESVRDLARKFGARVVAEGIEEASELEAVMAAGIDLVQGYLFFPAMSATEVPTSAMDEEEAAHGS
jgi:EAL domain-containing protein (putative c-di-GMP-specific phosphodiesterase class I)